MTKPLRNDKISERVTKSLKKMNSKNDKISEKNDLNLRKISKSPKGDKITKKMTKLPKNKISKK